MFYQPRKINLIFCFLVYFFNISSLSAQTFSGSINLGFQPKDEDLWWLKYNNFGYKIYPLYQESKFEVNKKKFELKLNIFSSLDEFEKVLINESYVKIPFKNSFIKFGKYYKDFSLYLNNQLSSGSILISNNAQAMPKIGIISKYRLEKQNISFDYGIAHGILDKNIVYSSSPFLHEKFIYINIENKSMIYSVGFVHEAIWAGEIDSNHKFAGKQPSSIADFLKVFISADGPDDLPHSNALGNHLGIWDFSFQRKINNKNFKLYYQHIFEDTSGLRFKNRTDGLWGIEFENFVRNSTILIEYLNTKNQFLDPPYVSENYYSHGLYSYGWSYKNYTLGNPLINHQYPIASDYIHVGLSGSIQEKTFFRINSFRELSKSDSIKYKLQINRSFSKDYLFGISIFDDIENGVGIEFMKKL